MKISIFTPTFNRAHTLEALYSSIQRQTFRNFEWLIVDDGSTDGTERLVRSWDADNNDFPIRYFRQENGGKCRAINRALPLADGKLFFTVDSDDVLTDSALEKIALWEQQLPRDQKYCGVSGNLGTSERETTNTLFGAGFLDGDLLDRYREADGERAIAFYTEIHRRYLYPEFPNEKFMTEAIAWNRMAHDGYRMRFFNDVICVYEYQDDGLTKAGSSLFLKNPRGYGLWLRERAEFLGYSITQKMRMWYTFYCDLHSRQAEIRPTARDCAEYIGAPKCVMSVFAIVRKLFARSR